MRKKREKEIKEMLEEEFKAEQKIHKRTLGLIFALVVIALVAATLLLVNVAS